MNLPKPIKCVLLGESGVGKSSLASRWVNQRFVTEPEATIGAAYLTRRISVDGVVVKIDLWDTAGQERYRSLTPMYYRGTSIAIIVFDATEAPAQQQRQVAEWRKCLKEAAPDAVVAVAGNKCDLCVTDEPCSSSGVDVAYWTSAMTNENVDRLFADAVQLVLNERDLRSSAPSMEQTLSIEDHHSGSFKKHRCSACRR